VPKYTQTFASLAPQFKANDEGVSFTVTVDASNRQQANRRLQTLLYGRSAVAVSMLKTLPGKRVQNTTQKTHFVGDDCPGGHRREKS
jgi:hypothetical protein